MWMVRFVTLVHKDLFFNKYFRSSKGEINFKILQATPLEPMRFAEVINKVGAGTMPKKSKLLGDHTVLEQQSDL